MPALFRSACRFALGAPPSGLRRASRQAERKEETKQPKQLLTRKAQRRKGEKAKHRINNLGGAKSDDQKGPNQVDKTRYARNELYRLQDSSVTSCNLYAVAANFGKFSLFKLTKEEVGKKKRPAEYLRIEVEIDVLSPEAKEALGDLLRNSVFIDGGFSSSARGTPARRLIFKKLFTPVFPTTYNSRDTWPMSAAHFLEFIASPEKYVRGIMGQHGVPPVKQQLELDNLMWP